jgi:hypothetical protein
MDKLFGNNGLKRGKIDSCIKKCGFILLIKKTFLKCNRLRIGLDSDAQKMQKPTFPKGSNKP